MTNAVKNAVILASGSPRRKTLLERAGIPFEVMATGADEATDERDPAAYVLAISARKADEAVRRCLAEGRRDAAIIAADTIVFHGGEILGKPIDRPRAFAMLKKLQDSWHEVYTGITAAFIAGEEVRTVSDYCVTKVLFKPMSDDMISRYIDAHKPFDKAGAYGIQEQGGEIVERIEGDYENVVGLPIGKVMELLAAGGADAGGAVNR